MAIGREMSEPEFRKLVDRSEALAALPAPDYPPSEFDLLVIEAIDNLPPEFQALLAETPVVISNLGHEHRAYGMYMGGTVARDIYPDRIVIYQDTLERDFGHHPDLLRAQVERTVKQSSPTTWAGARPACVGSGSEPRRPRRRPVDPSAEEDQPAKGLVRRRDVLVPVQDVARVVAGPEGLEAGEGSGPRRRGRGRAARPPACSWRSRR